MTSSPQMSDAPSLCDMTASRWQDVILVGVQTNEPFSPEQVAGALRMKLADFAFEDFRGVYVIRSVPSGAEIGTFREIREAKDPAHYEGFRVSCSTEVEGGEENA